MIDSSFSTPTGFGGFSGSPSFTMVRSSFSMDSSPAQTLGSLNARDSDLGNGAGLTVTGSNSLILRCSIRGLTVTGTHSRVLFCGLLGTLTISGSDSVAAWNYNPSPGPVEIYFVVSGAAARVTIHGNKIINATDTGIGIDIGAGCHYFVVSDNYSERHNTELRIAAQAGTVTGNVFFGFVSSITEIGSGNVNTYAGNYTAFSPVLIGDESEIDGKNVKTKTATFTLLGAFDKTVNADATAGAIIANVPAAASIKHQEFTVTKIDASVNTVTIEPNGSETINGVLNLVMSTQYESTTFYSDGVALYIK
jgi:hypothetical protein